MREYDLSPKYDSRKSFYGKAVVTELDEEIYLTSYKSKVCSIKQVEPDNYQVVIYNVPKVFSSTTLRHIKEFLLQNGFKADSKAQIQNDYEIKEV